MSWLDLIFDILRNASHYCPGFESYICIPLRTLVCYVCWIQAGGKAKGALACYYCRFMSLLCETGTQTLLIHVFIEDLLCSYHGNKHTLALLCLFLTLKIPVWKLALPAATGCPTWSPLTHLQDKLYLVKVPLKWINLGKGGTNIDFCHVGWRRWWKKLDRSEPAEGETQSQTAISRIAGNRKKARPPEECEYSVTFVQRRHICPATSFHRLDLFKTEKIYRCVQNLHQKTVLLHNPRWSWASPCRCSHLFPYLNNKLLKFCVFEQLFESLDVLMMNIDMWAVDETSFRRLW